MKNILKYALILAAAFVAGATYAQPAKSDSGLAVTTAIKDGVVTINIKGQCKSKMVSAKDELEFFLKQALEAVGTKTNIARAVESAFAAIKTHLADPNEPAFGPVNMSLEVKPDDNAGVIITSGSVLLAGEQYVANMKSTFNDDNTVTTTGNVKKISSNGGQETLGTIVKIDVNGNISVSGGVAPTSDKTVAAQQAEAVVNPQAVENIAVQGNTDTIIPDNTIITSSAK